MKEKATVVKHTGSHYLLSKLPEWNVFSAVIKGKLRLKGFNATNPIAVGDMVAYHMEDENTAVISEILPRKNCIVRRAANLSKQTHVIAANIDMAYLIVTIDFPETKPAFVDRFLVTCEAYNVPVKILLNKTDLYTESHAGMIDEFKGIYSNAGYRIDEISAIAGNGIERLKDEIKDKVVLFAGASGVGKSSLITAIDPSLTLKTGEISDAHNQGRHTTTFYEMHPISSGGFIIDMPGIRGFGLVDFKPEEISLFFPEMFRIAEECRFAPCTHTHEPGCAVKQAVEDGEIPYQRYMSYLGMLEENGKYR